jgi:glycosyltransferase involved in cell wall biosynthesis
MANILKDYSFGLSVCRLDAGPSLKAAMPTKIAEFLATGRPVVVNKGLGDFDEYLTEFNAGVILDGSESNLRNMAHNLAEILADPETPMRCRALAEKYFDVDNGAQKYLDLYPKILRKTQ